METKNIIKICEVSEKDVHDVTKIENDSFAYPWSVEIFCDIVNDNNQYFWKLEINSEIAGYLIFQIQRVEVHVANIAISSKFRKQGFARLLLTECMKYGLTQHAVIINLEVNENNSAAIFLYKSLNFRIIGKSEKYYENNDNALILSRNLK